jgi:hypothetical protein
MDLALLGIITVLAAVAVVAGFQLQKSLRTGRFRGWMRDGWAWRWDGVQRSAQPWNYWYGNLRMLVVVIIGISWLALLVPAALQGKRLHSRFADGTAVFDNEGVKCPGDPPGFTHYHTCAGPPVPVPP